MVKVKEPRRKGVRRQSMQTVHNRKAEGYPEQETDRRTDNDGCFKGGSAMNIIKHGEETKDTLMTEEFECSQCGCRFTADYDEYYVTKGSYCTMSSSFTYTYTATVTDTYACSCPECHKIVVKTKQRVNECPVITLCGTDTKGNIPDNCKNCSNHPSNGGSGNCNCTLGSMGQVTC